MGTDSAMTDSAADLIAKAKAAVEDETVHICINGHDRCAGGLSAGSDCPYCERRVSTKGRILSDISTLAEQAIAQNDSYHAAVQVLHSRLEAEHARAKKAEAELAASYAALADVVEMAARYADFWAEAKPMAKGTDPAITKAVNMVANNIATIIRSLAPPDAAPYAKVLEAAVEVVKLHKYPEKMRAEAALVAALAAIGRG